MKSHRGACVWLKAIVATQCCCVFFTPELSHDSIKLSDRVIVNVASTFVIGI